MNLLTFSNCRERKDSGAFLPLFGSDAIFTPRAVAAVALEIPVICVMELFSLLVSVGLKRPLQMNKSKKKFTKS